MPYDDEKPKLTPGLVGGLVGGMFFACMVLRQSSSAAIPPPMPSAISCLEVTFEFN